MALSIAIGVFGKHDLGETRNKIADILYENCRDQGE